MLLRKLEFNKENKDKWNFFSTPPVMKLIFFKQIFSLTERVKHKNSFISLYSENLELSWYIEPNRTESN